jgi:hypothetical protein
MAAHEPFQPCKEVTAGWLGQSDCMRGELRQILPTGISRSFQQESGWIFCVFLSQLCQPVINHDHHPRTPPYELPPAPTLHHIYKLRSARCAQNSCRVFCLPSRPTSPTHSDISPHPDPSRQSLWHILPNYASSHLLAATLHPPLSLCGGTGLDQGLSFLAPILRRITNLKPPKVRPEKVVR